MVFDSPGLREWGGTFSTRSPQSQRHVREEMAPGDVVVAYQTDHKAVVGFCRVDSVGPTDRGGPDDLEIQLEPIECLEEPLLIHEVKKGTVLASSTAVNGMVMLRELSKPEMEELVRLAGAPKRVLKGQPARGGYQPPGD